MATRSYTNISQSFSLSFIYSNVRSVCNKIDEFSSTVNVINPDIFCLSETWLSSDHSNGFLNLSNYNIFRKDRGSKGGGVLIGTHRRLEVKPVNYQGDSEIIAVYLFSNKKKSLRILTIYNPNLKYSKKI